MPELPASGRSPLPPDVNEPELKAVQDAPAITGASCVGKATLFTPGKIGPLTLKNRVIMASMTTRTADEAGFVTDDGIAYYSARA